MDLDCCSQKHLILMLLFSNVVTSYGVFVLCFFVCKNYFEQFGEIATVGNILHGPSQ